MLLVERIPDSRSFFRLVWRTTAAGNDSANTNPLPTVLKTRFIYIVCDRFQGTYTLYRGIYLPERGDTVWDTEFSVSLSDGSIVIREIPIPCHFYRVSLNPDQNYSGPIDVWTVIEGV